MGYKGSRINDNALRNTNETLQFHNKLVYPIIYTNFHKAETMPIEGNLWDLL